MPMGYGLSLVLQDLFNPSTVYNFFNLSHFSLTQKQQEISRDRHWVSIMALPQAQSDNTRDSELPDVPAEKFLREGLWTTV